MSNTSTRAEGPLVLVGTERGITLIPRPTPLTRLNYFDGKFLRADDLTREQHYLRSLVELSNQAGGPGVVHGFDTTLGDRRATLELRPGLAIDPAGRVLYLPHAASIGIRELIQRSRRQTPSSTDNGGSRSTGRPQFELCAVDEATDEEPGSAFPVNLYLISIAHVEALCGEEDVYGKLCEDACITSSDRPYRLEGVVVRATPLSLRPGTCEAPWLGSRHLRSQIASAYYADERRRLGRLMSGERLRLDTWCLGGRPEPGNDVPLAVVAVNGDTVDFLDAWTARRERMESPARRYWAWQMMMRPWAVYLAQILQFQCQLRDLLGRGSGPDDPEDPCSDQNRVLLATQQLLEAVAPGQPDPSVGTGSSIGERPSIATGPPVASAPSDTLAAAFTPDFVARATELRREVIAALEAARVPRQTRILIDGGIVELPAAGYLPVVPGQTSVNTQVRRLLGEGVDLRFCVVRPDYVAHALEEAQHMERICLLRGLENPALREEVDVLVPDGELLPGTRVAGLLFDTSLEIIPPEDSRREPPTDRPAPVPSPAPSPPQRLRGISRAERLSGGGGAFHFAGSADRLERALFPLFSGEFRQHREGESTGPSVGGAGAEPISRLAERGSTVEVPLHTWLSMRTERDPFDLQPGEDTRLHAKLVAAVVVPNGSVALDIDLDGPLVVEEPARSIGQLRRVRARLVRGRVEMTRIVNGSENENVSERFSLNVDLEIRRTPDGRTTFDLTLRHEDGVSIRLGASWGGAPLEAEAEASFRRIWFERRRDEAWELVNRGDLAQAAEVVNRLRECVELPPITGDQVRTELERLDDNLRGRTPSQRCLPEEERLGRATLREDPALAGSDHPLHTQALTTLARVGQALAQPGFRTAAERLLFPLDPAAQQPIVRATRDWVLFHRRREKRCGVVTRVVAPSRRYRLYHGVAPAGTSAAEVRRIIRASLDRTSIEGPTEDLLSIEFAGSPSRLVTAEEAIIRALRAVRTGERLVFAAMGSEGEAGEDPMPAMEERLRQVVALAQSLTPPTSDADTEVLPRVPAFLSTRATDGVMLLVTTDVRVATERHRVFSFRDQGTMSHALEVVRAGRLGPMLEELGTELGDVEFEAGRPNVVGNSLDPVVSAWRSQWEELPVARAVIISAAREPAVVEAHRSQGEVIANALDGQLTDGHERSDEEVYAGRAGLVFLEPGHRTEPPPPPLRRARLVATRTVEGQGPTIIGREPGWTVQFNPDGSLAGSLPEQTITEVRRVIQGVSSVVLATRQAPADSIASRRLDAMFDALHAAGLLRMSPTGAPEATRNVRTRAQIAAPLRLFDADGVTADDVVILDVFIIG